MSFATAVALSAGTSDAPYLGNVQYVDGVVRGFVRDILDAAPADEAAARAAGVRLQERAIEVGRHFLGEGATPMPDWNREGGGLGRLIKKRLSASVDGMDSMSDIEVVANAFAVLAHAVFQVMRKEEQDGDEEDAGISMNALIDDWRDMLLGMPTEDELAGIG